jgi:8-oxo-dGTP pyrophosphatase MutT (NUDIX family)
MQTAVVPYRVQSGRIEVALITSSGGSRWIFPKGSIDPGESAVQSARRETEEEAGLVGKVEKQPLGSYTYSKSGERMLVQVFLMRVTRELERWTEDGWRRRCWLSVDEAVERLEGRTLQRLLLAAHERIRP